jgi:hypothetical protein
MAEPWQKRNAADAKSLADHNPTTGTFPDMYYVWHPKSDGPVTADGIDLRTVAHDHNNGFPWMAKPTAADMEAQ